MSLLNNLMAHPLDEGYAVAARTRPAQGRPHRSRHRIMLVVAFTVLGFLLAIAASQNYRSAPAAEKERNDLIARVEQADGRLTELRNNQTTLANEVRVLQASGLSNSGSGAALQQKLDDLELQTGVVAVTGPGLKVVVDDAKDADKEGRLLDVDLQQLVNGLWTAGAEAISVNGHRLTSLTAIRGAGSAITVDYSSLTPPYTVLAIGDTATMPARFAQSSGGQWVQYLVSNFDVRMTSTTEDSLLVPADATIALRYAKVGGPK
ncbi:uncharacterized protein YlxW (UPF0749 family) [Kribbella sp. VKM Ac-2527]|uniref:Uncharacterized protein YlxW (UPF0749 family) n=2 Tax=Kribbella caucasensis TaxID=2512215 RepID=A0A4R6K716_9ACTN|nr:uncharacterized protein YlxW (UPF0749 family) [Kribbella sp. VKM Ac-2527]